jgi:hypothetical protein
MILNDDLKGMWKGAVMGYFQVNSAWRDEETSEKTSVKLHCLWFDILTF